MFTDLIAPQAHTDPDAQQRFLRLLALALHEGSFVKLTLSGARPQACEPGPKGGPDLQRVMWRQVMLRGERQISWLWRYQTRDITKNHGWDESLQQLQALLGVQLDNATLQTTQREVQLSYSRKGKPLLRVGKIKAGETQADGRGDAQGKGPDQVQGSASLDAAPAAHDRTKQRHLDLSRPCWEDLGLTHRVRGEVQLVPAMSRKWKQINKFIEIFGGALQGSTLADSTAVHVADFGSGKGYLTFAMHEHLQALGKQAEVCGVELRTDMVALCNRIAQHNGLEGLRFDQGDVREYTPARLDVMIALHACDIATDFAIHLGLRAKAQIIMCSPCCHKQLRPQMRQPAVLKPLLQHGIHLGQEAEMVTDGLRALLLESEGYDTQVFEFISLEHTSKNKMILATRRPQGISPARRAEVLTQIAEIKQFYGIREQALEGLLCPVA